MIIDSIKRTRVLLLGGLACIVAGGLAPQALPETPEPQGRCHYAPGNGQVLVNNTYRPEYGHTVEIDNGTRGDAIIKIRSASSNALQVAFYVSQGQKATFDDLPDGSYVIQYAFGDTLASDCRSFIVTHSADRFPGIESFKTTYVGDEVETDILGYTLYATASGNVEPTPIAPSDFNRD